MPSLYACIAKGETPYIIGSGLNMWDVSYISNVADAHVLAVENLLSARTAAGEAIFISNEQPVPFRDFCLAVWREFGHYPPFEVHIPKIVAAFAGLIADWVSWFSGTATTLSKGSVQDACATRYFSGRKAQRILGYVANIGIEEGIKRSCEVRYHPSKMKRQWLNSCHRSISVAASLLMKTPSQSQYPKWSNSEHHHQMGRDVTRYQSPCLSRYSQDPSISDLHTQLMNTAQCKKDPLRPSKQTAERLSKTYGRTCRPSDNSHLRTVKWAASRLFRSRGHHSLTGRPCR